VASTRCGLKGGSIVLAETGSHLSDSTLRGRMHIQILGRFRYTGTASRHKLCCLALMFFVGYCGTPLRRQAGSRI
jgi:hypothetical protein